MEAEGTIARLAYSICTPFIAISQGRPTLLLKTDDFDRFWISEADPLGIYIDSEGRSVRLEEIPGNVTRCTPNVPYHVHLFRVSISRGFEKILRHTKSLIPPHLAWTWYIDALLKNVSPPMRVEMLSCISKPDYGTTSGSIQIPRHIATEEKYFKYSPLPSHISNPIRLLILLPKAPGTGIRCLLTLASLDSSPKYEALSYVWGSTSDQRDIEINGKILSITSNLAAALHHLQLEPKGNMYGESSVVEHDRMFKALGLRSGELPRRAIVLWVDALCIDQANIPEKNDQIKRMTMIYTRAERVICWLGPRSDSSNRALEIMRTWIHLQAGPPIDMVEEDPFDRYGFLTDIRGGSMAKWLSHALRNLPLNDLEALILFFQRPWWTRAWIIQEIALAQDAVAMVGNEFIPFEYLVDSFGIDLRTLIGGSPGSSVKAEKDTGHGNNRKSTRFPPILPFADNRRLERRRVLFDVIRRPQLMHVFRCYAKHGGKPSLDDIITISRYQNVTNPRDKIFALLGLLASDHPCFGLVEPDYNISTSRLYTRFAIRHIERFGTLDILGLVGDLDPNSKIPSWVPDWRMMPTNKTLPFADITARPTFAMDFTKTLPLVPLFDAGLNAETPVSFELLFNEQAMRLIGVQVDKVTQIGDLCPLEVGMKPRQVIISWKDIASLPQTSLSLHTAEKQSSEAGVQAEAGIDAPAVNAEAFWRTVLADEVLIASNDHDEYRKRLGNKIEGVSSIPPSSEMEEFHLLYYLMERISTLNMRHCANRRIFRTALGYIGLGPAHIMLGDVVAVMLGGRVPLILRQKLDFHSFIGESYVHGIMDGKIIYQERAGLRKRREFLLI